MNTRFYRFCCGILGPFLNLLFPARVDGLEHLPGEGGVILCCNHFSGLDPVYLALHLRSRHIHFMAKSQLFRFPPLAAILKKVGAFPVDRGHSDLNAVRTALRVVSDGHVLGIFPQGTRSRDNSPTPMLSGVSMIALRAGRPVIPVYIDGPYRLFRRTRVRIGAPVDLAEFGRRFDGDTLSRATQRIESSVWALKDA